MLHYYRLKSRLYRKVIMRFLFFISLVLLAAITQAATFTVSTLSELNDALIQASSNGESDIIILSEGTYNIDRTIDLSNSDFDLTITGDPSIDRSLVVLDGAKIVTYLSIFRIANP